VLELVAISREQKKQRRLSLNAGDVVCIGRKPADGWAVPWDTKISREHARLIVMKKQVSVQQLDHAQNPIHFNGKARRKFKASEGDEFRIGGTTFQIEKVSDLRKKYGQQLATYRIQSEIGSGPLGDLISVNAPTGEALVMKIISPELLTGPNSIESSLERARAYSERMFSGTGFVYGAGIESGHLWIAREYVQGTPLNQFLNGRQMPRQKSLATVEQITRNLASLHEVGLCHLNLKPANVIYRGGATRLVDASPAGSLYPLVTSGRIRDGGEGITHYLAPEVAADPGSADIRSDLYSLGCLWYELLTGLPPFPHASLDVQVKSHSKIAPDWRQVTAAGVIDDELLVLQRLLSKSPGNRYAAPADLLDDLRSHEVKGSFVECGGCKKRYRVKRTLFGKKFRCKACGETIPVMQDM